ncbi:DUF721 domain-containing protein [Leptospirillum ferriphilum]|uniref:DUF721 domain-containing protein n=3 Tax=Leptospirillum TaxID=179 RepID=A0A2I2MEX0_9BACT|nr:MULTISPECIES: DUF721 domain-containing protein [Leptospirillum]AKS22891.1 hypothetical protein ABH19_02690 [Leptospirillum sp. Group II 'CF-1']EDZ39420.1 MAG: Protein of unknown function [Leptospirillum sp. Group II '5-way CG']EIJ75112.1 MAG: hypothetical protein C75L2_00020010 [Leptospirillum sp. Group II 'C75']MDA8149813.1 DUF721 domain-containing protein [Nitrospiraceae bacterium]
MAFTDLGSMTRTLALQWASNDDLLLAALRKDWERCFPGPVSAHSRPWSYSRNILVIAVDSALHRKEFSFLEPQFRQAIRRLFPEAPEMTIRFRVQRIASEKVSGPRRIPMPLSGNRLESVEEKARKIAENISDPNRREAAFRFALVCLIRGEALGLPQEPSSP